MEVVAINANSDGQVDDNEMKKPLRCIVDAVGGAVFTSVVAVVFIGALALIAIHFGNTHPVDRASDLRRLPDHLLFAAVAGLVIGAFAGLSSRLIDGRVSFLRSLPIIAICMVVARLYTFPSYKTFDPTAAYISYAATISAAVVGAVIVVVWGLLLKRSDARLHKPANDIHN